MMDRPNSAGGEQSLPRGSCACSSALCALRYRFLMGGTMAVEALRMADRNGGVDLLGIPGDEYDCEPRESAT